MAECYLYNCWVNMKQRCYNPKHPEYFRYGGRGIGVSEEWRYNFQKFAEDMGEKEDLTLSIERVDNNMDYCKDNCVWSSKTVQSFNQRVSTDNKSKIAGVYKEKQTEMWKAFISKQGKQVTLGRFKDFFEACCARKSAENLYYKGV